MSQSELQEQQASTGHLSLYEAIKRAILDGTFEPGRPLIEAQLATWAGVSRTPVREALTRLEQDGVIGRGERGLVVRDRSPEEILDIYENRIVLEAAAARIAADRHTSYDRIRLERRFRNYEDANPDDQTNIAEANRHFHKGVWLASHNDSLIDLLARLDLHLGRYPATTLSYPGRWDTSIAEHRELLDAIFSRDTERSAAAAEAHFSHARKIRLDLWREATY